MWRNVLDFPRLVFVLPLFAKWLSTQIDQLAF